MSQDTRAVNCDSCRKLISQNEATCPFCGANRAGASTARSLREWIGGRRVTDALFVANVVIYVITLAMTGKGLLDFEGANIFTLLGPSQEATGFLGVLDPAAVREDGEVWRLLTCAFLHAGILHIAFNLSWLRSIGPLLEEEFGSFRFACLYIGAALCGSLACLGFEQGALGASGAVFGLIGGGWAHGKRRGGVWGAEVRSQFGKWAISGIVFTALMSQSVSVPAHVGGLVGGAALGWLLSPPQRRWTATHRDPPWITLLGAGLLAAVPIAFVVDVAVGVLAPSRPSIPYRIGGEQNVERWPLRAFELAELGAPGWSLDVPRAWKVSRPDPKTVVIDGALGANCVLEVESERRPELDGLLRSALGDRALIESRIDLEAGIAEGECASEKDGHRLFVHIHRLDAERVLSVYSSSRVELDVVAWRGLCARIVESIRPSRKD